MNLVDIASILPFYAEKVWSPQNPVQVNGLNGKQCHHTVSQTVEIADMDICMQILDSSGGSLSVLRMLRMARIFRIFKVGSYASDLQVSLACKGLEYIILYIAGRSIAVSLLRVQLFAKGMAAAVSAQWLEFRSTDKLATFVMHADKQRCACRARGWYARYRGGLSYIRPHSAHNMWIGYMYWLMAHHDRCCCRSCW